MTTARFVAVLAWTMGLSLGCGTTEPGAQGPVGPEGPAGPPGMSAASKRIETGVFEVGPNNDAAYMLHTGSGDRTYRKVISFKTAFPSPPAVSVGLSYLDATGTSVRSRVGIEAVGTTSFGIWISTWADTRVSGAGVNWLAVEQ